MVAIPVGTFSYRRADGLLPSINDYNQFFENAPSNLKDGVAMLTRPTLDLFATIGSGPIRAIFWKEDVFASDAVVVSAANVSRLSRSATITSLGAIAGSDDVSIAASPDTVLIAAGSSLYTTTGGALSTMTFPAGSVRAVGFINGYFLAVPVGSSRIYYTDLITGEFDALRFISAERYPDDVIKLVVTSDEIWAFGRDSVEVFVPTGVDTDEQPPFQRVEGRLFKKGALGPAAIVEADNTVFWAGGSSDSPVSAYRGDSVPVTVSTEAVSERLARADEEDVRVGAFGFSGHAFVVFSTVTEGTWAYDIGMNRWHEWGTIGRDQWRAHVFRGCWPGTVLAGDDTTGKVYRLSDTGVYDNEETIRQVWTAGVPIDSRAPCSNVTLDCAVGQAAEGVEANIRLQFSDDQARTFVDEGERTLGVNGDYLARVRWDRLGGMVPPVRIFEWETTDPVRCRVSGARLNDAF